MPSTLFPVSDFRFPISASTNPYPHELQLARFFYLPQYVFLAIMTLYMVLIDALWIKF